MGAATSFSFSFVHTFGILKHIASSVLRREAERIPGGIVIEPFTVTKTQAVQRLAVLLAFAFLVRVCAGLLYYNTFDLAWYRTWALDLQNGFFDCYSRMMEGRYALDYPPVYLVFLAFVGWLYSLLPILDYGMTDMIAMKLFPILFDVLAGLMLYFLIRRQSETLGVLAAVLWALNPTAIFNSAYWGQTDGMMICLLLLSFYMVDNGRPLLGSVLFAVTALTKMQALYFTPVLFLVLWRRYSLQRALEGFFSALGTGVAAFLPFIIGGWKNRGAAALLTPFEVYFGGLGKYPYIALNTYNLYGIGNLNWVPDNRSLLFGVLEEELGYRTGGFTFSHLSLLFMAAVLALTVYLVWKGRKDVSLWLGCFVLMQGLFMLTTRMHERYQIAVLPFAAMLYLLTRRGRWLGIFASLSAVTFVNQFMLLIRNNTINDPAAPWSPLFEPVQSVMSVVNLALFAWSLYEAWRLAFSEPECKPAEEAAPSPAPECAAAEGKDGLTR